jgi:small-conductance mechanosensitive channel
MAFGAAAEDRAAYLREQITTLEGVVNATKASSEKARLEETLLRRRRELALVEEQQQIEVRGEQELQASRPKETLEMLQEKLRGIHSTTAETEKRIEQVSIRRQQVVGERDLLREQVSASRGASPNATTAQALMQERLVTKDEELKALAFEIEMMQGEKELAREATRLRERLRTVEAPEASRPSLKALFDAYTARREQIRTEGRLGIPERDLARNLKASQSWLELGQQKLAKVAEDLADLEKQTGFLRRDARIDRLLAEERSQKVALEERLPFFTRQVGAIKRAQQDLAERKELAALEATFETERFEALKSGYLKRLQWPAVALTGLIVIHLLIGYLLLPVIYKNESLFFARRILSYFMVVVATGVVAGFMFDDLKAVTATLGIVSAALVISLQDVCTSVFGWFVIMLGGKFKLGDRLEVEGSRGDVIDIELLRTTLVEINGWLGTDQPTGRVIVMPNNFIFKTKVFNYNHGHPFIWGRIDITVSFSSPIPETTEFLMRVLTEETKEEFAAAAAAAVSFQRRYGVQDAVYEPRVSSAVSGNDVAFNLFYVSHYRNFTNMRDKIQARLIAEFEKRPHVQLAVQTVQVVGDAPHANGAAALAKPTVATFAASATTGTARGASWPNTTS